MEGLGIIRKDKLILKLALFAMALNVTTIAGSLLVVLASVQYEANAFQFGIMNAVGAVAGIILGFFANKISLLTKPNKMLAYTNILAGVSFIGMGLVTHILFGSLFFMLMIASSVIGNIIFSSISILIIQDQYRGRVFTLISTFSVFLMPPFALLGGYVADLFHVKYLFYFAGVWMSLVAIYPLFDKNLRTIKELPQSR